MAEAIKVRITAREYSETYPETTLPMELIQGEVITFPTPKALHQQIILKLVLLLASITEHLGQILISPADVHFDEETVLQPDIFFVSNDNQACHIAEDGYWHGKPDLCVEVLSPSSTYHDRVTKFDLYARFGVREYWIIDAQSRFLEIYELDGDTYRRHNASDESGTLASALLPNLKIAVAEIFPAPQPE